MTSILFRHLFRQIFTSALSIGTVVIGIIWVIQSLRYIELVLNSQASAITFFKMSIYLLPDLLAVVLPVATFISVLFVYNRMIIDREIVVMEAAGLNTFSIAKPALVFGLLLMGCLYLINIYLAPYTLRKLRDLESDLKKSVPALLVQEGVFNTFGGTTVYVQKKRKDNLEGVFAYIEGSEDKKSYAIMAEEGRLIQNNEAPEIVMVNGNRQELDEKKNHLSILFFDRTVIELKTDKKASGNRVYKPYELPLKELLFPPSTLDPQVQQRLRAEGHQRLLTPFLVLAFVLIATSLLLRGKFSRKGHSKYILGASLLATGLESIVLILLSQGASSSIALYGAYLFVFIVCLICLGHLSWHSMQQHKKTSNQSIGY